MIRNLKVLMVGAMALVVLGAVGVSGAQAAEPEFHCSVEPCRATLDPDGAVPSKTAHNVFIIDKEGKSGSGTCNQITGEATSATKTTKEGTVINIKYHTCTFSGK
jgi:heat shock protein HslJ